MQIFRELAGYTFGHADVVRRAMAKKKASVMEAERGAFLAGCAENGIDVTAAGALFDELSSFANYAFNKSHAAAYAVISYRTAYLKEHAPKAYFAALLTSELGNLPKIAEYIAEVGRRGVRVLPPDINASGVDFTVEGDNIRFGLLALKNVGRQFLESVVEERRIGGKYRSFDDFLERMSGNDLNKRQVEALIKAGAFDTLGVYRSRLLAVYEEMIDYQQGKNRANITGQLDIFATMTDAPAVTYPNIAEFSMRELLAQEKEAAGLYFSGHVLDGFSEALALPDITPIHLLMTADEEEGTYTDRTPVTVAGMITALTVKMTKNGKQMAFFTVEDRMGEIECVVFAREREKFAALLVPDTAVIVSGQLSLREDEPPKVILSDMEELPPNGTPRRPRPVGNRQGTPQRGVRETAPAKTPLKTANGTVPRILYLRLPALSAPVAGEVLSLLARHAGELPVSLFAADTKTYHKQAKGIACDASLHEALVRLLGTENVVLK